MYGGARQQAETSLRISEIPLRISEVPLRIDAEKGQRLCDISAPL
jgi:hypothetical protein